MKKACFFIPLLIVIAFPSASQNGRHDLQVRRTPDFELSGDGKNKAWDLAPWNRLTPSENSDGKTTQFKMLYSDKGLYFLFHNEDAVLTATKTTDFEKLWLEDVVEVFLWPDTTKTIYFEYEISPLNYELPLIIPNFDGKFLGWIPWQYTGDRKVVHHTHVDGGEKKSGSTITAWHAEFFLPYALLAPLPNVPPKRGTVWRANMYRIDYDSAQPVRWHWKPIETNFHQYAKFGRIWFE